MGGRALHGDAVQCTREGLAKGRPACAHWALCSLCRCCRRVLWARLCSTPTASGTTGQRVWPRCCRVSGMGVVGRGRLRAVASPPHRRGPQPHSGGCFCPRGVGRWAWACAALGSTPCSSRMDADRECRSAGRCCRQRHHHHARPRAEWHCGPRRGRTSRGAQAQHKAAGGREGGPSTLALGCEAQPVNDG